MGNSKEGAGLSRRQFLTGVTVAGLAAAGAQITGCAAPSGTAATGAPGTASGPAGTSAGTSAGTGDLIAAAYLNPQDYDYRQNTTDFKTLFSPLKIGSVETSHRMIKSAAGSAAYLAGPTDELLQYYINFAKGGVELIWVEGIPFFEDSVDFFTGQFNPVTPEALAFAKKMADECGSYGAKLGYQWAAFAGDVGAMTKEDIVRSQDAAVKIAKDLKSAGFVALEINAAGFNLGEHFLSRFHNTRTDEYGTKTLADRARFVTECITKIKDACGKDFVVQCLIDCIEENDNLTNDATLMTPDNMVTEPHNRATTIEEGIAFAKLFEAAGCDSMHLRLGPLGNHPCQFGSDLYFILNGIEGATGYGMQWDFKRHWQGQLIGNHSGAGMLIDIVGRYKEAVSIPCGTVTYMDPAHAPDFFEAALADGKVDFFIMNRPLTVDTEYVNKLREGRISEIAPCTRCLHCHIGGNPDNRQFGYCRVNALTQRVMSGAPGTPATYELPPLSGAAKKVMVIGGGPGGMEAARIAAARGHEVTLYEKAGALGGMLSFASMVKGPHENLDDLKAYLERQLELTGVEVVLGKEVDSAFISEQAPDAVILAVGGVREKLPVSGDGSVKEIAFDDFMAADTGDTVVVWGSNAQAFDCALWLTVHKKNVIIVTPNDNKELDKEQSQHAMRFMTTALYSLGVRVWTGSSLKSISGGKVTIATGEGTEQVIACDSIIGGAQLEANKSLISGLSGIKTYAVGDCDEPYNIALAIRGGNDAGRAV
ncbi:MAG: FAD-dependent oxidoreductase [Coriobacteriaceae bacterium]|jgi:2,4-dienoyl-CoA reductase-like NADH-dependent reductase (Old Yellow Enzyme family)/thioredoxin reductase|nr:FAD-dependent oxidoreductase [Coriobacteriaceae bacterium]